MQSPSAEPLWWRWQWTHSGNTRWDHLWAEYTNTPTHTQKHRFISMPLNNHIYCLGSKLVNLPHYDLMYVCVCVHYRRLIIAFKSHNVNTDIFYDCNERVHVFVDTHGVDCTSQRRIVCVIWQLHILWKTHVACSHMKRHNTDSMIQASIFLTITLSSILC